MNRVRTLTLAVLALAFLSSRASFAQPPDDRGAERLFRLGIEAFKRGDGEEARSLLRSSLKLVHNEATLRDLAVAEAGLPGFEVQALQDFREWLRDPKAKASGRPRVLQAVQSLMTKTAHFTIEGAEPANVTVDEVPLTASDKRSLNDETPLVVSHEGSNYDVLPGKHRLKAKIGTDVQVQEVELGAGATKEIKFAPPFPVQFETIPTPQAQVQPSPVEPPSETHASERFWTTTRIAGTAVGVAAVAAMGVGVGFGVDANAKRSDWQNLHSDNTSLCSGGNASISSCNALNSAKTSQQNDARWATGASITAGVLAAGAVALWLLPSPREGGPKASVHVIPAVARDSAGFAAVGTF